MNKTMQSIQKYLIYVALALGLGLVIAYISLAPLSRNQANIEPTQVWLCPMHPEVRRPSKTVCPLCGMDLVVEAAPTGNSTSNAAAQQISPEAIAMAQIQTQKPTKKPAQQSIKAYGRVAINEQTIKYLTIRYKARIENIYLHSIGDKINTNDKIAQLYSADMHLAQQAFLEAHKQNNPSWQKATKKQLLLWNFTPGQIQNLAQSQIATPYIDLYANYSGYVLKINAKAGQYLNEGDILFETANLNTVWINLSLPPNQLQWLSLKEAINFKPEGQNNTYIATIQRISPLLNPSTHSIEVRCVAKNPEQQLYPDMYVQAYWHKTLTDSLWALPRTSVLWTGSTSVIFIQDKQNDLPSFYMKKIRIDYETDDYVFVKTGVTNDDQVVVKGAFFVDAALQLANKPSMLNP